MCDVGLRVEKRRSKLNASSNFLSPPQLFYCCICSRIAQRAKASIVMYSGEFSLSNIGYLSFTSGSPSPVKNLEKSLIASNSLPSPSSSMSYRYSKDYLLLESDSNAKSTSKGSCSKSSALIARTILSFEASSPSVAVIIFP